MTSYILPGSAPDKAAQGRWNRARVPYLHYEDYINRKAGGRLALSFTDLLYVKNFKGGMAVVSEPISSLKSKLKYYQDMLHGAAESKAFTKPLGQLDEKQFSQARELMVTFVSLPTDEKSKIKGIGPSFASALLHFYFPDVVPILDKRALNGARMNKDVGKEVDDILPLYPKLIDFFRDVLQKHRQLTLRELDRLVFSEKLLPPFKDS